MRVQIPGGKAGRGLMRLTLRGTHVMLTGSERQVEQRRKQAVKTIRRIRR